MEESYLKKKGGPLRARRERKMEEGSAYSANNPTLSNRTVPEVRRSVGANPTSFTRTCATPAGIVTTCSSFANPLVVRGAVRRVTEFKTCPAAPRYTRPAVAAEEAPCACTGATSARTSPGLTGIGALVQDGGPAVAALPPLPEVDALFEPSLPPSLHWALPAPVEDPDHPSGPEPAEFGCSKDPFWTLFP